jgi:hypothetical protein
MSNQGSRLSYTSTKYLLQIVNLMRIQLFYQLQVRMKKTISFFPGLELIIANLNPASKTRRVRVSSNNLSRMQFKRLKTMNRRQI